MHTEVKSYDFFFLAALSNATLLTKFYFRSIIVSFHIVEKKD